MPDLGQNKRHWPPLISRTPLKYKYAFVHYTFQSAGTSGLIIINLELITQINSKVSCCYHCTDLFGYKPCAKHMRWLNMTPSALSFRNNSCSSSYSPRLFTWARTTGSNEPSSTFIPAHIADWCVQFLHLLKKTRVGERSRFDITKVGRKKLHPAQVPYSHCWTMSNVE